MAPGSTSKVSKANPRSTSLQTVIPMGVVEQLMISPGDHLDWDIMTNEEGKYVLVRKIA